MSETAVGADSATGSGNQFLRAFYTIFFSTTDGDIGESSHTNCTHPSKELSRVYILLSKVSGFFTISVDSINVSQRVDIS